MDDPPKCGFGDVEASLGFHVVLIDGGGEGEEGFASLPPIPSVVNSKYKQVLI
jgi:hypothetical protein